MLETIGNCSAKGGHTLVKVPTVSFLLVLALMDAIASLTPTFSRGRCSPTLVSLRLYAAFASVPFGSRTPSRAVTLAVLFLHERHLALETWRSLRLNALGRIATQAC